MSEPLQYQLRIYLGSELAEVARSDQGNSALKPLTDVLHKHHATLISTFDGFANYVAEAEKEGVENYPLYKWTKATVEDPVKRAKHIQSFALHVSGDEVYAKEAADALEADIQPLVGGKLVLRMSKHDSNPANNPQMPAEYRP